MAKAKAKAKAKPPAKAKSKAKATPKPATPAKPPTVAPHAAPPRDTTVLRSLRSAIYKVDDLAKAKAFYTAALGRTPYFDQPFYVGYDIDGQELGLDPDTSKTKPGPGGAVAYWKVDDIAACCSKLVGLGGTQLEAPHDVGGGIQIALVTDCCKNLLGLIQLT